jgi:hypothetical protein
MKKALVILLAFALVFGLVFAACSNGTTGSKPQPEPPPPPPPPSGNADPIDVTFTEETLSAWGGGTIVAEADGNGFTFTYGTGDNANHGNAVAMFKVNLGEATVRDYEKVTFTFTGISGDLGPSTGQYDKNTEKGVNLLAAADKDNLKNFGGNDSGLVTYIVNAYSGAASGENINKAGAKIGTDQPATKNLELVIDPARPQALNTGEVWFSFYLHASAVKYEGSSSTTEKTSFKITNVKFVPLEVALGDIAVTEKDIPGVVKPVAGSAGVTTIGASTQYGGTVTWTPALTDGKFAVSTAYTAKITLEPKEGFTFEGVAENFFKVEDATATNPANSGVVTAVFSATGATLGPVYGLQDDDSYTLNPASWVVWYGATVDENAVSFITSANSNPAVHLLFPADFDIHDYTSVKFIIVNPVTIDEAGTTKSDGSAVVAKLILPSYSPVKTQFGNTETTTYGSAIQNDGSQYAGYKNPTKNSQYTWDFDDTMWTGTHVTDEWVGIAVSRNDNDSDDNFTITFESITFYP